MRKRVSQLKAGDVVMILDSPIKIQRSLGLVYEDGWDGALIHIVTEDGITRRFLFDFELEIVE